MSRFKTADAANTYSNNWAFEVDDTTSYSSETRTMKMVSIDCWNTHSDGRQEFIIQMLNQESSWDRVQIVILRVNNDGTMVSNDLYVAQVYRYTDHGNNYYSS
jgi:hypothetical protein